MALRFVGSSSPDGSVTVLVSEDVRELLVRQSETWSMSKWSCAGRRSATYHRLRRGCREIDMYGLTLAFGKDYASAIVIRTMNDSSREVALVQLAIRPAWMSRVILSVFRKAQGCKVLGRERPPTRRGDASNP